MTSALGKSITLWNLLTLFIGSWKLRETDDGVSIARWRGSVQVPVLNIKKIDFRRGFFGDSVLLITQEKTYKLYGVKKSKLEARLNSVLQALALQIIQSTKDLLADKWRFCDNFLEADIYISMSIKEQFAVELDKNITRDFVSLLLKIKECPFLEIEQTEVKLFLSQLNSVLELKMNLGEKIHQRNERFVERELAHSKILFDSVEKLPLTLEQRLAAVYFEDANLLVAAAGSGKTSSLVGKAVYSLRKKYFQPSQMLMLAFAKDAATELKERFERALVKQECYFTLPNIKTFHALGMEIIRTVEGGGVSLAPWAGNDNLYKELLSQLLDEVCQDPLLQSDMVLLVSTLMYGNATSYQQRLYYQSLFSSTSDFREIKEEIRKTNSSLRTLKGEMVRSMEELIIANWLCLHGVDYIYEKKMILEKDSQGNRKTIENDPDFYYPEVNVYHEHFGLDEDGKAPTFLGPDYVARVEWKRNLYQNLQVAFFETSSAMFKQGSIFNALKEMLKSHGLKPQLKNLNIDNEEFREGHAALVGTLATALKHIRNQGRQSEDLASAHGEFLHLAFHRLMNAVLGKYENLLKQRKFLDFEEMLIQAAIYVEQRLYASPYKFICIDEFQDISQGRRRLVKALLGQVKGATLFAVGDDWQGIYRFAGADLDIFTRAANYFGSTKELYLTNTFRSNQGIADVAASFIQKNPLQKKKTVQANDKVRRGILKVLLYKQEHDSVRVVEEELEMLAEEQLKLGRSASIFILARYNFLQPHRMKLRSWAEKYKGRLEISTMSFHSSKGLEADYVFILGMNSGSMGFPSMRNDHPFVQMYMAEPDKFPFAEERRLFYVALTRAKRKVFFVTRRDAPSSFLQELYSLPEASLFFDEQ